MSAKLLKSIVALLLVLVPVNSIAHAEGDVNVTQINFVDVKNDYWANNAIVDLARNKVISGYEDQTFKPENKVTREEFASLIAKTFYLDLPGTGAKQTYQDVPSDHWSFPYIEASKEFLTGYFPPSGKAFFSPALDATREDVAVTLVKSLGYKPDELRDPKILDKTFRDVSSISPNLRPYVSIAVEKQLFSGYPDGTFRGDKQVSRAEVATLLYKIIKNTSADGNTDLQLNVSVPETTSNGTFYVSGDVTKGATVTINDKDVKVVQGQFKEGLKIDLGEGTYKIVVVARIAGGKSKTITKEIKYEKGGPQLTVNEIAEQAEKQQITVSWAVKDDNDSSPKVYVNDELLDSWKTSKTIDLIEGDNTIVFKAVNNLGKSTSVTKIVKFNSGAPVLKVAEVPETTDKQTVTVSWSVTDKNDSAPNVFVNDELQDSWKTSKTITLVEGVNTIVFKATNSLGKSSSITKTISLGSGAPVFKVGEVPTSTTLETLSVSWSVTDKNDANPKVYINESEQDSWKTSKTLTLEPGNNDIVFKAINSSGKTSSITKTINFNPPAPTLSAGTIPSNTSSSTVTVTWTVSDKNDSAPKVFIKDELQDYWKTSKSITLTKGANPINFTASNKFGKETTVTKTVYKD